jgi:uncharacterized RDD family membrane protein YckC
MNNFNDDVLDDKFHTDDLEIDHYFPPKWKRLLHLIGDSVVFYIITAFLSLVFAQNAKNGILTDMEVIVFYFVFFSLWFVFEFSFGKTPLKFLTKTKVVTQYGGKPTMLAIAIRTICRLIPFEWLTYLGNKGFGWHDTISKTRVVTDDFVLK